MSSLLDVDTNDDDLVQVLTPSGELRDDARPLDVGDETLLDVYADVVLARRFDERAVSFQRQGRIATYAPMAGQEGAQVASAHALGADDWLFPTYRDHAAKMIRGLDPGDVLGSLRGLAAGYTTDPEHRLFPEAIPIATQIPHAVGASWAGKLKGEDSVAMVYFGDGATSEGDFHEGLNFAGVFDTPTVFFCNNNGWAISVPTERQTAAATIAQKADAYGFEGVRVDGMDPLAVYRVTRAAVAKARREDDQPRPTLIEAVQYRMGAHTTADDPSVYRDSAAVEPWEAKDPLLRLRTFLLDTDRLDTEREASIRERADRVVADAIEHAEAGDDHPDALFEHVFAEPTANLRAQRAELERQRERLGDDAFTSDH